MEELAHAIREVHRVIEAKEGKEMADQMIDVAHRLALMSDEEIEKEHEKIKRENEKQIKLLEKEVAEFFNNLFSGGNFKQSNSLSIVIKCVKIYSWRALL